MALQNKEKIRGNSCWHQWVRTHRTAGVSRDLRSGALGKEIEVVAVNDIVPADNLAYLVKYDSIQGRFPGTVTSEKSSPGAAEDDVLVVNGQKIKCLAVKEGPAALPWKALGVES